MNLDCFFYNTGSGIDSYLNIDQCDVTYDLLRKHLVSQFVAVRDDYFTRLAGECLILGLPTNFILIEPDEEVFIVRKGFSLVAYEPELHIPYVIDSNTISLNKRMWIPE